MTLKEKFEEELAREANLEKISELKKFVETAYHFELVTQEELKEAKRVLFEEFEKEIKKIGENKNNEIANFFFIL